MVAAIAGGLDSDVDRIFEWTIDSSVGLVALVVQLTIGVLGSIFWLRAAWSTWRLLDMPGNAPSR